jgi:Uma2 family endonuclease
MSHATRAPGPTGEPAWEVARLFPDQGAWSEADYLELSNGNRLVEYTDGVVDVLPIPTTTHQLIVLLILNLIHKALGEGELGLVLTAPLRVRVSKTKYREPDIVVMLREHYERVGEPYWEGADLVVEVVSEEGRQRDVEVKRADYAEAGIPEFWIVDPGQQRITVLTLDRSTGVYNEASVAERGQRADSRLLPGLVVDAAAVFDLRP